MGMRRQTWRRPEGLVSPSRLPALAGALLADIPLEFVDDGCSASPDALFGYDLRWACQIHDWWWCTRAHPLGSLTEDWKAAGDHILGVLVRSALPYGLRWIGTLYLRAVRKYAGAYNSCGHDGEKCRHGLARPPWMHPLEREAALKIVAVDWDARSVTLARAEDENGPRQA